MTGEKQSLDALRINKVRCVLAIVVCSLICVLVYLGVTDQVLRDPDPLIKEVGWKTYHMFTILSNMLMALAAAMCIPFAVDGMRYRNYHLPRWYVNLMYAGTTGVAITFIIALTVLTPAAGFYRVMLFSNNILLHLTCPVLSILLFVFINSDHKVRVIDSIIAIMPAVVYALLYLILVFAVGEDAGGWRDHYQIYRVTEYLPIPVLLLLFAGICMIIATALRLAHNIVHERRKADVEKYYQQAEEFAYPDIKDAVRALALADRVNDKGGELIVPRRIISMMERKYQSGVSVCELCCLYVRTYYSSEGNSER